MAYINQTTKGSILAIVKPIADNYGVKLTLAIQDHCKLVCTIHSYSTSQLPYSLYTLKGERFYGTMQGGGKFIHHGKIALDFFDMLMRGLNKFNYDNSHPEVDYFDTGYYVELRFSDKLKMK